MTRSNTFKEIRLSLRQVAEHVHRDNMTFEKVIEQVMKDQKLTHISYVIGLDESTDEIVITPATKKSKLKR